MMCCNNCPFNPANNTNAPKCDNPICKKTESHCSENFCAKNIGSRCFMDYYVIDNLYRQDELAEGLAMESLRTALIGRDRALLISLFQAAQQELRIKMWNWLEENEPRSLWMLNPIFAASGLNELNTFTQTNSRTCSKYLEAIVSNQYSGRYYKQSYNS
ncbi:MAG: hypothetical protein II961_05020 [Candidatus Riflebacteria bacterium]|nr:hypothetical protein [Candidatus Riflebacteria bacterium]